MKQIITQDDGWIPNASLSGITKNKSTCNSNKLYVFL
jgi:hypothetical protein